MDSLLNFLNDTANLLVFFGMSFLFVSLLGRIRTKWFELQLNSWQRATAGLVGALLIASALLPVILGNYESKKLTESVKQLEFQSARLEAELDSVNKLVRRPVISVFPTARQENLWDRASGRRTVNLFDKVPRDAQGVLLKVNLRTMDGGTGSFTCADREERIDSDVRHFSMTGISNYGSEWIGGLVLCPLTENKTITWLTMESDTDPKPSDDVETTGALIGWYR
jgi:hypothetical protein